MLYSSSRSFEDWQEELETNRDEEHQIDLSSSTNTTTQRERDRNSHKHNKALRKLLSKSFKEDGTQQ